MLFINEIYIEPYRVIILSNQLRLKINENITTNLILFHKFLAFLVTSLVWENKPLYEIWYRHTPNFIYFKIFGRKCYIKKDELRGNFDSKSVGLFIGYFTRSKS